MQPVLALFRWYRRRTRVYDTPPGLEEAINEIIDALVPAGSYVPTSLATEPDSGFWKLCDGQSLLKADYPRLYGIYGSTFGETATTFQLPDLRGRTLVGKTPDTALFDMLGNDPLGVTPPDSFVLEARHLPRWQVRYTTGSISAVVDTVAVATGQSDGQAAAGTDVRIDLGTKALTLDAIGNDEPDPIDLATQDPAMVINWLVRA